MQHQDHDLSLVAGLAAGDLSTQDRARARRILDECAECTSIHADLIAIATATRALPRHARAPRDYRLSDDQAARLRRRSWLRALLAPFAASRSATRPMAAALTTLGLVGVLVITVLPGLSGSAMLAPERQSTNGAAAAAPTAAPAGPAGAPAASAAPAPNGPDSAVDNHAGSPPPDAGYGAKGETSGSAAPSAAGQASDRSGTLASTIAPNLLLVGSLVVLGLGLALFGLRFAGRRLR